MSTLVYRYLDHKSDVYVHAVSDTIEGVFKDAAVATFEIMLNVSKVHDSKTISVGLEADDLEQLLYLWVDKLLYTFDAESFALSHAEIKSFESAGRFSLYAVLHGDDYDPAIHEQRSGVKAMTYSLMRIFRQGGRWEAYFVLDI